MKLSSLFICNNNCNASLLLVFLVTCSILLSTTLVNANNSNGETKVRFKNQSTKTVIINWIHPKTREGVFFSELGPSLSFGANSFVGHEFQFVEKSDTETGQCEEESACKEKIVMVSKDESETIILTDQFQIISEEELLDAADTTPETVIESCKKIAHDKMEAEAGRNNKQKHDQIVAELGQCIKMGISPKLRILEEEKEFEHTVRTGIAHQLENFTCVDPDLGSSPDVRTEEWISSKDSVNRQVHIKLDRPASRIHVVEQFASPDECQAMEDEAASRLHDASVADGKGGTQISENRKAKQAGITPNFAKEAEGNLIARLSRRVYDYTNHVLGLNVTEHGQEPLMSIQYSGRGYEDGEPDRYRPHCDGRCDGDLHPYGTRMATMVIYCTIPERGGHTQFMNAGVHIKPEVGSAIFFSYIDPLTNLTDHGFTQHSGCPVYEGEKKIVTQWVRYGVNGSDRSHSRFNTLGILHSESGEN